MKETMKDISSTFSALWSVPASILPETSQNLDEKRAILSFLAISFRVSYKYRAASGAGSSDRTDAVERILFRLGV